MPLNPLHTPPMASHPLVSTIVTLYTITFLYFPTIAASPLIISTSLLLLSLLRLGAAQRISPKQTEKKKLKSESEIPSLQAPFAFHDDCANFENDSMVHPVQFHDDGFVDDSTVDSICEKDSEGRMFHADCSVESIVDSNCENDSGVDPDPDPDPLQFHDDGFVDDSNVDYKREKVSVFDPESEPRPFNGDCFVEWNVRAPLEVIYEAYEGEEEEEEEVGEYAEEKRKEAFGIIERYASLSMYYPETDTDTDSSSDGDSPVIGNWDSPEDMCFRWYDDEDREELIEIELDCKRNSEVEEENLIEIDLTPANFPAR